MIYLLTLITILSTSNVYAASASAAATATATPAIGAADEKKTAADEKAQTADMTALVPAGDSRETIWDPRELVRLVRNYMSTNAGVFTTHGALTYGDLIEFWKAHEHIFATKKLPPVPYADVAVKRAWKLGEMGGLGCEVHRAIREGLFLYMLMDPITGYPTRATPQTEYRNRRDHFSRLIFESMREMMPKELVNLITTYAIRPGYDHVSPSRIVLKRDQGFLVVEIPWVQDLRGFNSDGALNDVVELTIRGPLARLDQTFKKQLVDSCKSLYSLSLQGMLLHTCDITELSQCTELGRLHIIKSGVEELVGWRDVLPHLEELSLVDNRLSPALVEQIAFEWFRLKKNPDRLTIGNQWRLTNKGWMPPTSPDVEQKEKKAQAETADSFDINFPALDHPTLRLARSPATQSSVQAIVDEVRRQLELYAKEHGNYGPEEYVHIYDLAEAVLQGIELNPLQPLAVFQVQSAKKMVQRPEFFSEQAKPLAWLVLSMIESRMRPELWDREHADSIDDNYGVLNDDATQLRFFIDHIERGTPRGHYSQRRHEVARCVRNFIEENWGGDRAYQDHLLDIERCLKQPSSQKIGKLISDYAVTPAISIQEALRVHKLQFGSGRAPFITGPLENLNGIKNIPGLGEAIDLSFNNIPLNELGHQFIPELVLIGRKSNLHALRFTSCSLAGTLDLRGLEQITTLKCLVITGLDITHIEGLENVLPKLDTLIITGNRLDPAYVERISKRWLGLGKKQDKIFAGPQFPPDLSSRRSQSPEILAAVRHFFSMRHLMYD